MAVHNPKDHQARLISLAEKEALNALTTVTNGVTALAGGTQAGTPVQTAFTRVTTVATAADSVLLPPARQGMQCIIVNAAAANSMNVFPSTGDAINAAAANAAFAMAANKTALFTCVVDGIWNSILTA